jgi:hypothetical protein
MVHADTHVNIHSINPQDRMTVGCGISHKNKKHTDIHIQNSVKISLKIQYHTEDTNVMLHPYIHRRYVILVKTKHL